MTDDDAVPDHATPDDDGGHHGGTPDDDVVDIALDDDVPAAAGPDLLRRIGWIYLVAGLVGLLGSAMLAIERIASLRDADHVASCSINAALDCAPAMDSWQGSLLGFPNPLLGLGAFPVVMLFGAMLAAGLRPPRWMWLGMAVGATLGMALIVFLIYTSLIVLVVLCPYCFVVWLATWPVFWYTVVALVHERIVPAGERARAWVVRNRFVVAVGWYLVVGGLCVVALRHQF